MGFRLPEPPELPAQTCKGRTDIAAQNLAPSLLSWLYRDSAFTPSTSPYSRPLQSLRSHFPRIEPYVGPIAAWRLPGSADLALGWLLSRPVPGLTGPSPPPSPSGVPRRSCPGCRRQGPGPQVHPHREVPGPAPPRPSLLPSLLPLPPPPLRCLRRFRCLLSGFVSVGARG